MNRLVRSDGTPPDFVPPLPTPGKGLVFKSSFTPGLENAEDVLLSEGTRIKYKCREGVIDGTVKSGYRKHTNGAYGYEVLFDDTGGLAFADERQIIGWDGKGAWDGAK